MFCCLRGAGLVQGFGFSVPRSVCVFLRRGNCFGLGLFCRSGCFVFLVAVCGSLKHLLFKLCLKLVFLCCFLYLFPSLLAISILVMDCS